MGLPALVEQFGSAGTTTCHLDMEPSAAEALSHRAQAAGYRMADQVDIRSGFRLVLDSQPDMTVVGEAADGKSAVAKVRDLTPDVVLADIRMPGPDGLEVTRLLAPSARVIVVTTFDLDDYVHTALRNGACGFLPQAIRTDPC